MNDFCLGSFDVELVLLQYGVDLPYDRVEQLFEDVVLPQERRITSSKPGGRFSGDAKLARQTEIAMTEIAKLLKAKKVIPDEMPCDQ